MIVERSFEFVGWNGSFTFAHGNSQLVVNRDTGVCMKLT